MDPRLHKQVARLLGFLILVDLVLSLVGFVWPELWFRLIHGTPAHDPQRFLQRVAAAWLAFLGLQVVAYWRFARDPVWLALIAGVRLSDMLADWTQALYAADLSTLGHVCLLAASPVNALAGVFLLRAYRRVTTRGSGTQPSPRASYRRATRNNFPNWDSAPPRRITSW